MNDFLPKPLRQADLLEMLKKYIINENNNPAEDSSHQENYLDINILNEQIGDDDEDFRKIFLNLVVDQLTQAEENIKKAPQKKTVPT